MSNNNIKQDTCNYRKTLYQSTQPLAYILNTPQDKYYNKNKKNIINNKQFANVNNNIRGVNCIPNYQKPKNLNRIFNNFTRIQDDKCLITTEEKQNMNMGIYNLSNYHSCTCAAPQVAKVALNEPTVNYRDGYGHTSMDGCNIDADSLMRNGTLLTNTKCINQLNVRPHLSTPYMGRGAGNPCVESILQIGEDTSQRKPCNTLQGIENNNSGILVPCMEKNIQNPHNLIPELVSENWIRGGVPSRQLKQNANIFKQQC